MDAALTIEKARVTYETPWLEGFVKRRDPKEGISIFFKDELFTEERPEKELKVMKDKPIQELINGIIEQLRAFSKGALQSDDITMVRVKFYGK